MSGRHAPHAFTPSASARSAFSRLMPVLRLPAFQQSPACNTGGLCPFSPRSSSQSGFGGRAARPRCCSAPRPLRFGDPAPDPVQGRHQPGLQGAETRQVRRQIGHTFEPMIRADTVL
ncbi:hypothetical protein GCM10010129_44210 [Streptomyces fumigatiscleroticus]|nr:hypothetical protein GCM10010129_44210 [Streptomyces fumigatiscleroticus]